MTHLFVKSDKDFETIALVIFKALGINNFLEGDSQNVLDGYYYSYTIFGVEIKLEKNSYDYEDQYEFMLSIKKNMLTRLSVDSSIVSKISDIVIQLLKDNTKVAIALETETGLSEILTP